MVFSIALFGSEGTVPNLDNFRRFVSETVRNLGDLSVVRVGVVFFSDNVSVPITLGQHNTVDSFMTALNAASSNIASSFVILAEGIEAAIGQLNSGRQGVRKTIVVVSGRRTENITHGVETANAAKRQGIEIIGAGFGGNDVRTELQQIATVLVDEHVFISDSGANLPNLAGPVNQSVCTGE